MRKQVFFLTLAFSMFSTFLIAQVPSYVPTNGLVAYWGFTGNANDSSGNNYNGSVNGATLTTDRFGNANSAYSFNGSSNYIAIPHNSAFNIQQATWNVWVKINSASSGLGMYIFGKRDNAQHHVTFNEYLGNGNGSIGWAANLASGGAGNSIVGSWHMLTITYNQSLSSNNMNYYFDGVNKGVTTVQPFTFANGDIRFGIEVNNSYWQAFNGLIDDASIYNRILSQTEIQQIFTGPTTVASCPSLSGTLTNGLVAYYPFCGNANDASGNNNNGTVNGATLTTDRFGNANSAYSFNGISNYIQTNFNGVLGNSKRTLSFWAKSNTSNISQGGMAAVSWGPEIAGGRFDGYFNFNVKGATANTAGSAITYQTPHDVDDNNWHHYIYIVDIDNATTNDIKIYQDGILLTNNINSYNPSILLNTLSGSPLKIGKSPAVGIPAYYNGLIDDIIIYNRALTQTEISSLYNQNICYQSVTVTDTLIINTGILSYNPLTYNNTITIYPNPANDHITIDCGTLTNVVGYSIKITNTLGQEVFNQPMNTQQYYVPLNSWTGQGVYFVSIINAQGNTIDVRKIILQ